jgi:hypothetical protein
MFIIAAAPCPVHCFSIVLYWTKKVNCPAAKWIVAICGECLYIDDSFKQEILES